MSKIYLILGPPGSGKTTLGSSIERKLDDFKYASLGEFCRSNISRKTQIGAKIKSYLDRSVRYDNAFLTFLLKSMIEENNSKNIILDGVPRFFDEVSILKDIMSVHNPGLCFNLNASFEVCKNRCLIRDRKDDLNELDFRLNSYFNEKTSVLKGVQLIGFDVIHIDSECDRETILIDVVDKIKK